MPFGDAPMHPTCADGNICCPISNCQLRTTTHYTLVSSTYRFLSYHGLTGGYCGSEFRLGETWPRYPALAIDLLELRFWGASESTIRDLIGSINASAFIGTNPIGELIASGLPVIRPEFETSQAGSSALGA